MIVELLLALIPIDVPITEPVEITVCGAPYVSAVEFEDSMEGDIAWAMVHLPIHFTLRR
jgi:hypothetical protein